MLLLNMLAFINEIFFTNKYLVSNIRLVAVRGTRNMTDGKREKESERKKERRNEEREKRKEKKERVKKPHQPFPKTT